MYNDLEDNLSDDDVITTVKAEKLQQCTKRAEQITEVTAIGQVCDGVKFASTYVRNASCIPT
jgi:hypothetical protein